MEIIIKIRVNANVNIRSLNLVGLIISFQNSLGYTIPMSMTQTDGWSYNALIVPEFYNKKESSSSEALYWNC